MQRDRSHVSNNRSEISKIAYELKNNTLLEEDTREVVKNFFLAANGYVSYAGRYEADDTNVYHNVEVSLIPQWVNTTLTRKHKFSSENNMLELSAEFDGFKRVINTMLNNVTQNTDIIETLRKQGERMEEARTSNVKDYIEQLGGVPETLLSIGMIGPIILAILGIAPQLMEDSGDIMGTLDPSTAMSIVNAGLIFTLIGMAMTGIKAHTTDPGL